MSTEREEGITPPWFLVSESPELKQELVQAFATYQVSLTPLTLEDVKTVDWKAKATLSVFICALPKWPTTLELPDLTTTILLSTQPLQDRASPSSKVDFAFSLQEFRSAPHWFTAMLIRCVNYKTHGGLSSHLRDQIIEKLNAKSQLLEMANQRLEQLSVTDDLTGTYNHRFFRNSFHDEMERAQRYQVPLSLLMIDVDHFKEVNDKHGHIEGDRVLKTIADLLKSSVRRIDLVCRYGGEEFAIILPMTSRAIAVDLAERIRTHIERWSQQNKKATGVTISLGAVSFPEDAANSDDLLLAADQALYKAKHSGRNRVATVSDA